MKSKIFVFHEVALLADKFIEQIYSSILHRFMPNLIFKQRNTFIEYNRGWNS